MKLNRENVPMINAKWESFSNISEMELFDDRLDITIKNCYEQVKLRLTFPTTGGVRLCTADKTGFFEPDGVLPIQCIRPHGRRMTFTAGKEKAEFNRFENEWHISILTADDKNLLELSSENLFLGYDDEQRKKAQIVLPLSDNEKLYGFGQRYHSFDAVGTDFCLWNIDCFSVFRRSYINIPFVHSSKGYSMFFNSTNCCEVDAGANDKTKCVMEFEGPKWDMFLYGGAPSENISNYLNLTGMPWIPPKWAFRYWAGGAFGVWQSKGMGNHKEVLRDCLEGYKKIGIDNVAALFGEKDPFEDKESYPLLAEYGTRMLGWNHPSLYIDDMKKLIGVTELEDVPYVKDSRHPEKQAERCCIDFTHPNAQAVIEAHFKDMWDWGLKGCMVDYGEINPIESVFYNGLEGDEMRNLFAYYYGKVYHDAWSKRWGDDYVLFERAGCAGSQHWVANFNGDQVSTFDGLRRALNGMLTLTSCGMPICGSDIGGFGGPPSPELYIRWLEFSTFSPLMRAHGCGRDRNPWTYGRNAIATFQRMYWLRESMLNMLYSSAVDAHKTGNIITKAMPIAYPGQNIYPENAAQFMFCDQLMICPVVEEGKWDKKVIFPEDIWYDFYTGAKCREEREQFVWAYLEDIPVYVKSDAIVPLTLSDTFTPCDTLAEGTLNETLLVTAGSKAELRHWISKEGYCDYTTVTDGNSLTLTAEGDNFITCILFYGKLSAAEADGKQIDVTAIDDNRCVVKLGDSDWKRVCLTLSEN